MAAVIITRYFVLAQYLLFRQTITGANNRFSENHVWSLANALTPNLYQPSNTLSRPIEDRARNDRDETDRSNIEVRPVTASNCDVATEKTTLNIDPTAIITGQSKICDKSKPNSSAFDQTMKKMFKSIDENVLKSILVVFNDTIYHPGVDVIFSPSLHKRTDLKVYSPVLGKVERSISVVGVWSEFSVVLKLNATVKVGHLIGRWGGKNTRQISNYVHGHYQIRNRNGVLTNPVSYYNDRCS